MRIHIAQKSKQVFQVTGEYKDWNQGKELLFSSYNRQECLNRIKEEKSHWIAEGYKKIGVRAVKVS